MKSIHELLSAVENHAAAAQVSTATTSDTQTPAATAAPPIGGPAPDPRQMQSVVIGTLLADQPQSAVDAPAPAAAANGKAAHGEQPTADHEQAERLLKELETVVAEVRAGNHVQSSALSHLEARFDELKLGGHETEARLLRLIQQLLEAPDERPLPEPANPAAAIGYTPAVTSLDDQVD
jgi:hypothetical protein